jgi:orotidine-5'-phosphate decarboxylase
MTDARDRLCVALDGSDREWISATAAELAPHVGWIKLGLEAFTAHGPELIAEIAAGPGRLFLDLKLHDIPTTVRRASANCASLGVGMFNVHASGGREMLEAASAGASEGATGVRPTVLAVTILTSLDRRGLAGLGIDADPRDLVLRWARLAQDAGLDGVVASAHEAAAVRSACGDDFLIVTPGIRPGSSRMDDQRRVMTPAQAIAAGSDILVIGRPITGDDSPIAAVRGILDELI